VRAGKHIFAEKPVAVDAPGIRTVLVACREAQRRNLALVSGLCWRYHEGMRETFRRVHDGVIGDIVTLQCVYNTGELWHRDRQPGWSDMEWQMRNWLYFTWLSGDHIVEQHVHSIDKMAWAMKDTYPERAVGLGGRQVRTGAEFGHIFDHHAVVFEYANGVKVFSSCRQQAGCANEVRDYIVGTNGRCDVMGFTLTRHNGQVIWRYPQAQARQQDMYQNEHNALFASIRNGRPINDGGWMTKSSLMAILGRMATYTGQVITWQQAITSRENLTPARYEWGPLAVAPVARPGETQFS
jgi:predicted dehydrogenase